MGGERGNDVVGECWRDLADVISAGVSRVLLYGPPGTGKTFAALHFGVAGTRRAVRVHRRPDVG